MQIDMPSPDEQRLAALAAQKGFANVEEYARDVLQNAVQSERLVLSDDELQHSLQMCDRGMAEADAGKGRDFNVALDEITERHGLNNIK